MSNLLLQGVEQCQYLQKMDENLRNELQSEHKAILVIVNALNHGKSIDDIFLGICLSEFTERSSIVLSKALMNLADEICLLKQIETVTANFQCESFQETSLQESIKLFIAAVESSHITVGEVFSLLHPEMMTDILETSSLKTLPICCTGERNILVSYTNVDISHISCLILIYIGDEPYLKNLFNSRYCRKLASSIQRNCAKHPLQLMFYVIHPSLTW